MGATIKVSPLLREYIETPETLEVVGENVKECLLDLIRKLPDINTFLFDRNGIFKAIVTVNGKIISQTNFSTQVSDHDELRILMPMDGG